MATSVSGVGSITSTGLGSGLNVTDILDRLMAVEQRPLELLKTAATGLNTKLSNVGKLQGLFSALRDKASADLDNARRTAAQNARQAYLGVTSGLAQVKAFEAAQVSSRSALDANKLGYEVGVRINIDVLNAQSQLFDTQQKLAKARYDTLMAQLKLKAAAGTLGDEDIKAINALLD